MRVTLRARGWLRYHVPDQPAVLDVPEGTTASGVMELLRVPVGPCLWVVNGEAVGYDAVLHDGDELDVALMASGG